MTPEIPALLDVSAEEMSDWRELTVSKLVIDWLRWERQRGIETVTQLVMANRIDESRIQAGLVEATKNILERLESSPAPLPAPPDEPAEKSLDPATRPSLRRKDAER